VKVEGYIFASGVVFFGLVTPIYWLLSEDPTGTAALALSTGMALLISFYVLFTARRLPGPRPEDRVDAEVHEGSGELGFFAPHSWWPLAAGLGAAAVALGVAVGWWLVFVTVPFLLVGVIGFIFEFYLGEHQH
jgi:Cytochrome c oxidase subunit IV